LTFLIFGIKIPCMTQDTTKTIHRSASRFFSGTLISRATGMLRDMAMAFAFGTGSALSAFMVAYRFAHLARRLFGEGSLQNTFIPHFEALRQKDSVRAFQFFRDLSASLSLVLLGLIAGGVSLLLLVYQVDLGSEAKQILLYTALMLPSLLFICLYGLNAALLGCERYFFIASIAPVAFNVVWILAAFALAGLPFTAAMIGLSLSVIFACMAQWAVTLPSTAEILPAEIKKDFFRQAQPFSDDVKALIKPLLLANFGVAASQINNALDPVFALFANSEGPAWLWFAIRVQQLPLALFGIALASAMLPPISRAIKACDMAQFHQFFHFAERRTFALTSLITVGIFATAPTCINLLFGRGEFNMESVAGTSLCLLGYGVGLFPMAYVLIAAPALFALGDYKTPSKGAGIAMALNIGLNSLFVFGFHWNSASVALATSLAAFWNAYYLSATLNQRTGFVKDPKRSLNNVKTLCTGALALSAVWMTDLNLLGYVPALQLMQGLPLELSTQPFHQIGLFTAEASVFCVSVGLLAYLLEIEF
jgi:putative peptidoglycan lipid II flippase